MKGKSFWFLICCFLPPVLVCAGITKGFRQELLSPEVLLIFSAVLLLLLLVAWYRYVDRPTFDFLNAINRAIRGDYRARFSCCAENDNFRKLSAAFNQLMSCVESQTEELTENRHLQTQLYENEKIYRSALELTCERVFEADLTHNRLIYGHHIYQRAFPFLKTEMFDDMIRSIADRAVFEEDAEKYYNTFSRRSLLGAFRASGATEINLEYRQKNPSGDLSWVSATVILLSGSQDDDSLKVIGYVKNIDAKKRQELEILKQSQKDGLTGIYNKKFTQSLIEEFLSGEGASGRHAAIMVDIDNFKQINDTFGHIQGDAALALVAQRLAGLFRSTDIVGRIGGDEFFVLMQNYSSADSLIEKLYAVRDLFGKIRLEEADTRVSGSIGVSLYPEDGTDYRELYKKADVALYYSKAHGKDRFYLYSGRHGEKYGFVGDNKGASPDEVRYVPHERPIENAGAGQKPGVFV